MPDTPEHQLLKALRDGGENPFGGIDWEGVVPAALRHGVAALLRRRAEAAGALAELPDKAAAQLAEERHATALANLANYGEFRRVARALGAASIPVLPLKGLHLAELVYRDISLRPMSDLDVLVPRERVSEALRALRAEGFGHDEELGAAAAGLLDTKCNVGLAHAERGTWLEVHWALDEPGGAGPGPIEAIWRSAREARLGDIDAKVMAPEFLLLHVCAHLACNHAFAFSLRGLCDIAEIVRAVPDLDWAIVEEHGKASGWTRGVAAALRIANEHLGVTVPARALHALGADALEPEMLQEALTHLLEATALPEGLVTAPNLLAAAGASSLTNKVAMLWGRVFVPRAELALLYGVAEDAPHLPFYYAARLRDLIRRYATGAWSLAAGDPAVAAAAQRHVRLAQWVKKGVSAA